MKITIPLDCRGAADPARRSLLLRALACAGSAPLFALGGCASAGAQGLQREWNLSQTELLNAVAPRFPLTRRVGEIFDLHLLRPRLKLRPADNKLVFGCDVGVDETLFTRRTFDGNLTFATGLRYEASDGTVRLDGVRGETFSIAGLPGRIAEAVERVGPRVVEEVLQDHEVHRFDDRLREGIKLLGMQPGDFRVTDAGVRMRLVPIPL
ncbi:hypothetical protein [Leptothrix discophora]|uniref:DUF1439 domain-containing protein n=1 Tax=Leptothrix discophora TaxID=89 RepID=A0ABT9FYA9_LEPDI|nr:hypothetical protein [Leptothrix discophora]MDP4299202.1 hypothetical protein [Leptothrix discophora]